MRSQTKRQVTAEQAYFVSLAQEFRLSGDIPKQSAICDLFLDGHTFAHIASRHGISEKRARAIIAHALRRGRNQAEAIARSARDGRYVRHLGDRFFEIIKPSDES